MMGVTVLEDDASDRGGGMMLSWFGDDEPDD